MTTELTDFEREMKKVGFTDFSRAFFGQGDYCDKELRAAEKGWRAAKGLRTDDRVQVLVSVATQFDCLGPRPVLACDVALSLRLVANQLLKGVLHGA